ncbi:hypothetical protein D3C87_2125260 [compost metagenome]
MPPLMLTSFAPVARIDLPVPDGLKVEVPPSAIFTAPSAESSVRVENTAVPAVV